MSPKRLISGSVAFAITALAVFNEWVFIAVVCFLTAGGLYEFFYMIKKKDIPIYSYTGIFIGVLIPLSIFTHFELTRNWELLFIVCAFLLILLLQFAREDNRNAVLGLSTTLFGVLYVSWFFSFLVKIRLLTGPAAIMPDHLWGGPKLLGFIICVTKASDIGAMLFGTLLGKHPLLPKVSPNKSIEGSVGGLLLSAGVAVLCRSWLPEIPYFTVWYVAVMGAFFGALGQLGDLSESLIKRDCQVKDSGKLLPGIGGVLDSIDSLLFSAPAFYLYMSSTLNLYVK
ncbi:MAG: phosphatidate cytidylyltransferase [Candidatus Omnitrophica bacterium]|nr:phosphatidate cytidylyltransferase [Candidatus Omnitrophota bacterium]